MGQQSSHTPTPTPTSSSSAAETFTAAEARLLHTQRVTASQNLRKQEEDAIERKKQEVAEKLQQLQTQCCHELPALIEAALFPHMNGLVKSYRERPVGEFYFDLHLSSPLFDLEGKCQICKIAFEILQKHLKAAFEEHGWHVVIGNRLNLKYGHNLTSGICEYSPCYVRFHNQGTSQNFRIYLSPLPGAYVQRLPMTDKSYEVCMDFWYQSPKPHYREETCVVCHERSSSIHFISCGHEVVCATCYVSLSTQVCPFCRIPIEVAPSTSGAENRNEDTKSIRTPTVTWKVGDMVRIQKEKPMWNTSFWSSDMDKCLGQTGKIIQIFSEACLKIKFESVNSDWLYFRPEWCQIVDDIPLKAK